MTDTPNWPPLYVDEAGGRHSWDDTVAPTDAEENDGSPRPTYRELAYDIADRWGGIEEFITAQWLLQGVRFIPESEHAACPECGLALHPGDVECDACGWMQAG